MWKFLICFTIVLHLGRSEDTCPDFISCESSIKPNLCPNNTVYRENVHLGNCCPGCVTLKDENEPCQSSKECQPGLKCSDTNKCEGDPNQACEYYKRYDPVWKKLNYWKPSCLTDGTFAPKQCKGEKMSGKCYCADKRGKRIFGEELWFKAENMTCACSRLKVELQEKGFEKTFHCDSMGNFEPLQCDKEVCWCASINTGIPYTPLVPEEMMNSLPCYKEESVGSQYFRKCDSEWHMQEKALTLLKNHGTKNIFIGRPNCNFDGSYHRVQKVKDKTRCVYIDNSPLTEAVAFPTANCNCAYDSHVYKQQQMTFLFDCEMNGNYKTKQNWDNKTFCVDQDGFTFSDKVDDCNLATTLI